jgi:hypothetical protein
MRVVILSFLLVAPILAAGCLDPGASPTPTANATVNATTNGSAMLPKVLLNQSHNFATGAAADTPAGGNTSSPLTVPAGYVKLNLSVRFSPGSPAPAPVPAPVPAGAASGVSVKLGSLACDLPDGPLTAPVVCVKEGVATPGDAKVEYAGEGNVRARVTVTAS